MPDGVIRIYLNSTTEEVDSKEKTSAEKNVRLGGATRARVPGIRIA